MAGLDKETLDAALEALTAYAKRKLGDRKLLELDARDELSEARRYWDPDPAAPDKTYPKIGGWVRNWEWNPLAWHLPIPPKVGAAMDDGQKWAVACTRAALADHGRPIDGERTAIILGNAMAGGYIW